MKIPAFGSLGWRCMIVGSAFSIPRAIAGNESLTRLIKSSCKAVNGLSQPITKAKTIAMIAPKFPANKYEIAFLMLSKTFRPTSTARMIEAKLSSVKTIAAASLATSVPVPIAIPISACFKAGASLTPSPVMAEILPLSCQARTIRILFSGETRA